MADPLPSVLAWDPACSPDADLLVALEKSRHCSATDPRDKVFGILSLTHASWRTLVPIDYSVSWQILYTQVAKRMLEDMRCAEVLKNAAIDQGKDRSLPTWVPRWNVTLRFEPLQPQFTDQQMHMLANWDFSWKDKQHSPLPEDFLPIEHTELEPWSSSHKDRRVDSAILYDRFGTQLSRIAMEPSRPKLIQRPQSRDRSSSTVVFEVLRVRAHRLDEICETDPFKFHQGRSNALYGNAYGCCNCTRPSSRSCDQCNQSIELPIACISCQDDAVEEFVVRASTDERERLGQYYSSSIEESPPREIIEEVLRKFMKPVKGERAAFQTFHSAGRAIPICEIGDTIWAIDGLRNPCILRKEDEHYLLVTECYIYGALRQYHPCMQCGSRAGLWPIKTEIIEIW